MGGAQNAHVDRYRTGAADPHDFPFFQYAQQAGLQLQRHFADFVEKQRAALRRFEQAGVTAAPGTGECAFLVAEQFGLQQRFGHRAAVDGDECLARARA